jgi:glycosyltransferase involved in cell wall biosynthesis
LLSALPTRLAGVPLVWHKVDFSWDRLLARPLAAASTGVITTSRALAEPLGRLQGRHLGVVWPPIRLPKHTRTPGPRDAIGTVGRLVPYKGHHLIVRAAALLRPEFPDVSVVLAGGPVAEYPGYRDELIQLADELDLRDRVELTGHVEDVAPVLDRLAVFVNATYRDDEGFGLEGLSGAVLEACWAGLPVVATQGGGTAEQIVSGETGTLVAEPTPDALAAAIAPYLRDAELAARTGEAGRRFVLAAKVEPPDAAARLFELLGQAARGYRTPNPRR